MKVKITFWITASVMILWFGIGPLFAYDDPASLKVIQRLGYPLYFSPMLTVFKVLGVLAIVVPGIPSRIKEWAYAGFAIDLISAIISFLIVDGFIMETLLPITALLVVLINYYSFDRIVYRNP